jgi:hypothetical protein
MKRLVIALLFGLSLPQVTRAEGCDPLQPARIEDRVREAALALERLNGGGSPLTTDLISYSGHKGTWAVFFRYSGIQNVWKIETDERGCLVTSVSKLP